MNTQTNGMQAIFTRWDEQTRCRQTDVETFKHMQSEDAEDGCMLCGEKLGDFRDLFVDCFYDLHEVVPDMLDISDIGIQIGENSKANMYYLRICKSCRSRFLEHMAAFYRESVANRGKELQGDGFVAPDANPAPASTPMFVRVYGATRMLTQEERNDWMKTYNPVINDDADDYLPDTPPLYQYTSNTSFERYEIVKISDQKRIEKRLFTTYP